MDTRHVGPLGHDFNNDDLACSCGQTYHAHAQAPRPCPLVTAAYNRQPKPGSTQLQNLRVALGLSNRAVANHCGVSQETARRAIAGDVGGKGRTSPETAERVSQFIHDMARALKDD